MFSGAVSSSSLATTTTTTTCSAAGHGFEVDDAFGASASPLAQQFQMVTSTRRNNLYFASSPSPAALGRNEACLFATSSSPVKPLVPHGPIYIAPNDPSECLQFSPQLESITDPDAVRNFTVTHPIHGSIRWLGDTDISQVNINECIRFESRAVQVHGENFPGQGFKLNKPAVITLHHIFPKKNRPMKAFQLYVWLHIDLTLSLW